MSETNGLPELPKGWALVKLAEIAEIMDVDHKMPKAVEQGIMFISPKDFIESDVIDFQSAKRISEDEFKRLSRKCKPEVGDILYSRIGTIGKARKVPANIKFHISYSLCIVRSHPLFEGSDYFFWLLKSPQVLNQALEKRRSIGVPDLGLGDIRNFQITFPPLPEQQRIVAKIEELFTKLDAGVAALKTARVQLGRYRQAILNAAVTGELTREWREAHRGELEPAADLLTRILRERRAKWEADQLAKMQAAGKPPKNDDWKQKYQEPAAPDTNELPELPKGWIWTNLEQLKQFSIYGPRYSSEDYSATGTVVLRTSDISKSGKVFLDKAPKLTLSKEEFKKYKVELGDLLITRTGSIGTLAVFNDEVDAIPGAYLIHYRLMHPKDLAWYLFYFLLSPVGQRHLIKGSAGIGRPNLNAPTIESIPIPLPPVIEQQQIVSEVERLLSIADAMEQTIEQSLKQAERMRQSILQQAFAGQLVPQDPADEPAESLLARIRAERAQQTSASQKPRPPTRKQKQPVQPDMLP